MVFGADYLSRNVIANAIHKESPSAGADLVVILDWFNGGRENWLLLEDAVREARRRGAEVVLCTDNEPRDTDTTIYTEYKKFNDLAEAYGVAICDTRSYLEYRKANGEANLYADGRPASKPSNTRSIGRTPSSGSEAIRRLPRFRR